MHRKAVIVTGSSGYLGSKIISANYKSSRTRIIGLDFKNADINLDLRDYKSLRTVKESFNSIELVHLAGQLPGSDSAANIFDNSYKIITNLIEVLEPSRTLFLSSTAVYPTEFQDNILVPKPWEAYGFSKLAVENYLLNNSDRVTIYRSGTMYDENRKGGIQKLMTNALHGKPTFIPRKGNVRHPFVLTSDVVKSILFWVDNPGFLEMDFTDLVASNPVTMEKLICENSSFNPKIFNLPSFVRKIGSDKIPVLGISKWHINALYYDIASQLKVSNHLAMKPMLELFKSTNHKI
jgi:nucleoside-diphosphate-sugar epimerase